MLLQVGANNMCISPTRVVTIFIHNTIIVAKNIYYFPGICWQQNNAIGQIHN